MLSDLHPQERITNSIKKKERKKEREKINVKSLICHRLCILTSFIFLNGIVHVY